MSRILLAPLEGTQRRAWWLAVLAVGLIALLGALLSLWQMQPLARLRERAWGLAQQGDFEDSIVPAPLLGDEVGTLTQLLDGLVLERSGQALRDSALTVSLQAILDHAPVGIVITRAARLSMLGRQAAQMLGYNTDELLGQPVRALYASDAAWAQGEERARAAFAAHGAFDGDLCFARKDGSPVWARVQGRAAEAPGMSAGIVWILEELTAVHEARRQRRHERLHDPITGLPIIQTGNGVTGTTVTNTTGLRSDSARVGVGFKATERLTVGGEIEHDISGDSRQRYALGVDYQIAEPEYPKPEHEILDKNWLEQQYHRFVSL